MKNDGCRMANGGGARVRTEDETTALARYLAGDPERLETFLRHARERRGCTESPYTTGQRPETTPETTERTPRL